MTTNLKALCGFVKPNTKHCENTAIDASGRCYAHSPLRAAQRSRNSARGGRTAGRGRPSISKEIRGIRELTGAVIEVLGQDRLPRHVSMYLKDLLQLLKLYTTLVNQELRASRTQDLVATHSNSARQLIDVEGVRSNLEDLVHNEREDHLDDLVEPDDPDAA